MRMSARQRHLLSILVCGASAAACTPSSPAPQASASSSPAPTSASDAGTPFNATLACPINGRNPGAKAVSYAVGPQPCDAATLGEACRTLIMTEEQCTWSGATLGGQALTQSVMHGQGYMQGTTGQVTSGYDWGTVANGDSYLSRWTESLDFATGQVTAVWTPVLGTGVLKGITGEAKITCAVPSATDTVETCTVAGSYKLPNSR